MKESNEVFEIKILEKKEDFAVFRWHGTWKAIA